MNLKFNMIRKNEKCLKNVIFTKNERCELFEIFSAILGCLNLIKLVFIFR